MRNVGFGICLFFFTLTAVKAQTTTKLSRQENSFTLFGRKVALDKNGFPKQIETFFNEDASAYRDSANLILAENIHFHFVRKSDGKNIKFVDEGLDFTKGPRDTWQAKSISDSLQMDIQGYIHRNGLMRYTVKVTALGDISLKDITMHIPMQKTGASFLAGFGKPYGARPEWIDWKWEGKPFIGRIWTGNPNAGLKLELGDEKSIRSLPTATKIDRPTSSPNSWDNHGKGGITIGIKGSSMLINSYTGERQLKKGEVLYFNFELEVTPNNIK